MRHAGRARENPAFRRGSLTKTVDDLAVLAALMTATLVRVLLLLLARLVRIGHWLLSPWSAHRKINERKP
jgi:hypothetical protein